MSNYNLKAKNKLTGRIYDFTAIDNVMEYSYIQEDLNVTLTSNDFNQLFEVIPQTDLGVNDDTSKKDDILENPNHPYGGMETWRDRLRSHEFIKFDDETFEEQINYDEIENFFQQELERICEEVDEYFDEKLIGEVCKQDIINIIKK